jgi:hypothetical protein
VGIPSSVPSRFYTVALSLFVLLLGHCFLSKSNNKRKSHQITNPLRLLPFPEGPQLNWKTQRLVLKRKPPGDINRQSLLVYIVCEGVTQ